jgi:hypothetical protein
MLPVGSTVICDLKKKGLPFWFQVYIYIYICVQLALGRNVMFRYHLQLICLSYFRGDNFGEPVEQSFAQQ